MRASRSLPALVSRDALLDRLPAVLAVLVGAWALIMYSVGQWRSMTVPSWDLAIFSELAKNYAHGQGPIVPIKGDGFNLLGDHFHPVLVLLGPLWRLFPTPLALLVLQDLLLAVSAWPITRTATRLLGRSTGAVLGLLYALSWGFQGAAQAQFHEIAFAVPMLAWASAAFVERRWWACALWLVPLVLVKEDLGLVLVMAGPAIMLRGWQQERENAAGPDDAGPPPASGPAWWRRLRARAHRVGPVPLGGAVALFGALAFVLTVLVILPLLSSTGSWQYGLSGNSGDGMAATRNSAPLLLRAFSPGVKTATLFMLVCTAGLIGLASPWMTLMLPTLAWRLLAGKEAYWQWKYWHYNAVLIPIALGALLDVVARLRRRRARRAAPAEAGPPPLRGALLDDLDAEAPGAPADGSLKTEKETEEEAEEPPPVTHPAAGWSAVPVWARRLVALGVTIPLVTAVVTAQDLPLWSMTQKGYGATSPRWQAAQQVLATVPEGASVETDLSLLAYLVPRADVFWVGTSEGAKDYVVIDSRSTAWGGRPPKDAALWATQSRHVPYELVLSTDGFQVAKRVE